MTRQSPILRPQLRRLINCLPERKAAQSERDDTYANPCPDPRRNLFSTFDGIDDCKCNGYQE